MWSSAIQPFSIYPAQTLPCWSIFTEKCGIESVICIRGAIFLSHAMFGLKSLPCLEEKMTKLKSDAGFVSDFSGQQQQVGMGVIFILSLGQQHNSLICSYINITPWIENLRLLKTLSCYCNWTLIMIWVGGGSGQEANGPTERNVVNFRPFLLVFWIESTEYWLCQNNFCKRSSILAFWRLQK